MENLKKRSQMDPKYCWNMSDLFESDTVWENEYSKIENELAELEVFKETITESPDNLLAALDLNTKLSEKIERIYVYANQKSHEDISNSKYQDMADRAQMLLTAKSSASSYIHPSIMKIGADKLQKFICENEKLAFYQRYFDLILRQSEHIMDSDTEQLLANVNEISEAAGNIFLMFNNADIKFPEIEDEEGNSVRLTNGRYILFLQSKDRKVRKAAFEALYTEYAKFENTLSATFRANVKQHIFFAKTRKYNGPVEYSLSDANIPVSVYDNLIGSVRKYLPLLHRYISIRKEALGLDELHMYDLYVPMVNDVDMVITYEEAKEIVKQGLAPLGKEYQELLQKGFDEGWIDVYENEGKRGGAYSWGAYGTHPYVLLNHQDNLNSVFTLAHEMGHALHSYYSDANQPYIYAGYKIFVAEVASTCNEALLVRYLIDNSTDESSRKYLINYFLEQFRTTFYRQTMFAEFEKTVHEKAQKGETLTPELLCSIYKKLNEDYFGKDTCVDEFIAYEWARIPHFYNPFYVYQYATGFAAAIAISSAILEGNEEVIHGYKKFLSSGGSLDPIDLLKLCGVDMTTAEPIDKAMKVFEELLDEF